MWNNQINTDAVPIESSVEEVNGNGRLIIEISPKSELFIYFERNLSNAIDWAKFLPSAITDDFLLTVLRTSEDPFLINAVGEQIKKRRSRTPVINPDAVLSMFMERYKNGGEL